MFKLENNLILLEQKYEYENNNINVKVLKTTAKWQGITYKEDKEALVAGLNELVEKKEFVRNQTI